MVTYEIKKKGYKYIVVSNLMLIKGDLFTEIFLCWLLSLKKCAKHCPEHLRDLDIDLAHFFGGWSQSEKLYEIEPPLARLYN